MKKRVAFNNLESRIDKGNQTKHVAEYREKYLVWSTVKVILDPEHCFPVKQILFEDIPVFCFKDPAHYLIRHYGENFMELPAEKDKRIVINHIDITEAKL